MTVCSQIQITGCFTVSTTDRRWIVSVSKAKRVGAHCFSVLFCYVLFVKGFCDWLEHASALGSSLLCVLLEMSGRAFSLPWLLRDVSGYQIGQSGLVRVSVTSLRKHHFTFLCLLGYATAIVLVPVPLQVHVCVIFFFCMCVITNIT